LASAARTASLLAPKVYDSKIISTYKILWHLDCFVSRDKVNRATGRRAGASFFARHLDSFIVTQNSQPSPGLGTVKTIYRDSKLFSHLPGLAKNVAPRRRRQLIKPPGR